MILEERAIQYANDVIDGKEITTWEVKKQCEIFINDYKETQFQDDCVFYFDENKLSVINNLLKLLNFATGFVARKQVLENLAPFQCFLITNIFAWRFKDNPLKFLKNDITLFLARKNAKTAVVAIIFILLMLTEQNYSEFYSICLTKELAAELRKAMTQILEASPLISKHFTVSKTFTGKIKCNLTQSFYQPRVNEAGKNNSVRPCGLCSDEHANFQNADNFNAMKSGMKNVINPVVFRTTTAYAISNSIMQEDITYIRKVFKGVIKNDRQFALLYYADKENLWNDTGMYQASPLRIEENYNVIREERETAKEKPSCKIDYITKDMNNFLQSKAENKYIDIEKWMKHSVPKIDLHNQEVVVGCDFAISMDLNAISIMCENDDKYYLISKGYLPQDTLAKRREKIDYLQYADAGYCEINKGDIADYEKIEQDIRGIESKYNCKIKCIVSDPYNAIPTMNSLGKDYKVIPLVQSFSKLSPSIKAFRDEVYKGNMIYQYNKLLDYCVSNAVEHKAKITEDILLAKENQNKQRIDLLMSSIFAFSQLYIPDNKTKLTADSIKSFYSR